MRPHLFPPRTHLVMKPGEPGLSVTTTVPVQSIELGVETASAERPCTDSGAGETECPGVTTVVEELGDDVVRTGHAQT